ncbi:MAG: hypothetical protein U9R75_00665 [Candidatus Thermoplasmatota archaeon]|nr:hypothetical protein [Candidatus Thermoplasmatota archaeon]
MQENKRTEEVRYRISPQDHLLRRGLHLLSSLVVIYYLFPPTFFFLPMKFWLILLLGIVPFIIEIHRMKKGSIMIGQREYEKRAIGSYAWSLWTSAAIILVLPQEIGLPVILIYTLADPVIGEIRLWKKWLVLPLGGIFTSILFIAFGFNIFLAGFAALFMIVGEALEITGHIRSRPELLRLYKIESLNDNIGISFKTDDNATTQLVPALALGLVYIFYPGWFPGPWLFPLF